MVTDGEVTAFTVMVIELLELTAGLGQSALLVIKQLTTSPFCRLVEANVLLFVPTLNPLICH